EFRRVLFRSLARPLRYGKLLCPQGRKQTAPDCSLPVRPFTTSARSKISVSGSRNLVCFSWVSVPGPRYARVRRSRGHSSWNARFEHVELVLARLYTRW